jgi:hypothetical protein
MKTSNYILLSFFIFLFGGITLLFVFSKSRRGYDFATDFKIKEDKTAPFSVVVAEPDASFDLKNGEEFKISQSYLKEGVPNFASYEVRNDTLFMYSVKQEHSNKQEQSQGGYFRIVPEVYCKNVTSIIAKEKTNIRLSNYHVDSLSVTLDQSEFNWDYGKIALLNIQSKNSYVHLNGDNIEKINLQFDKTSLYMDSKKATKEISGSLSNDSEFQGSIDGKVSLEVDKSSRTYIR